MHFHVSWKIALDQRNGAEARFLETGAPPPPGVALISRWHDLAGRRGFMIVESTDAMAVSTYLHTWTDLLTFEITPVLNDEQTAQVLKA